MNTRSTIARLATTLSIVAGVAALQGGCSLVLDGSRHQGGSEEGGVDDAGEDADAPDPCANAPTARCGAPVDEECPPIAQSQLAFILDGEPLGQLRPTTIFEGQEDVRPSIAMEAIESGGELHGSAILLAVEGVGAEGLPRRLDVPLHDFFETQESALEYATGPETTATIEAATSVALARESILPVIGMAIANGPSVEIFSGDTNLVTLETSLGRFDLAASEGATRVLDDVGATSGTVVRRTREGDDEVRLKATINSSAGGPPFPTNDTTMGVPAGEPMRILTTTRSVVALQDEAGGFFTWVAQTEVTSAPTPHSRTGQSGKAAWVSVDLDWYVLVYQAGGSVYFESFECLLGQCASAPLLGDIPRVSALAPTGEVPAAVLLPDGRVAALVTERYAEGDRLVLQVLEASLTSISLPRVPLLDLRPSGERVADAAIKYVGASSANTLLVAAAVGGEPDGASRLVMTGLRSCVGD
jgi:hypothetical protein